MSFTVIPRLSSSALYFEEIEITANWCKRCTWLLSPLALVVHLSMYVLHYLLLMTFVKLANTSPHIPVIAFCPFTPYIASQDTLEKRQMSISRAHLYMSPPSAHLAMSAYFVPIVRSLIGFSRSRFVVALAPSWHPFSFFHFCLSASLSWTATAVAVWSNANANQARHYNAYYRRH